LSFLVGFAMLGSITYMPTFFQYVDGASATGSGIRMVPLVGGLMVTALLSGVLVSKTGRYKIFPVIGMPVMVVGFVLLAQLDEHTSVLVTSLSLIVVGLGIGLSMQVLTLVVQSAASYDDIGVSTSGVTFFRTLGSSFGTAVFGALYANFLNPRLATALKSSSATVAKDAYTPSALHKLPRTEIATVVHAYATSLDKVFIWAAPVAGLGFLLALILKEVPLRGSAQADATDLGESFAMPQAQDSRQRLERAISGVLRRDHGQSMPEIVSRAGTALTPTDLWAVLEVALRGRSGATGRVTVADIAEAHRMPALVITPLYDRLLAASLLAMDGDALVVAPAGAEQLTRFSAALRGWLVEQLAWEHRPSDDELSAALDHIVTQVIRDEAGRRLEPQPA
jgi:MFS family permease